MNQSNKTQWARCPAGYLVSLTDEKEKNESNMSQRSKNQKSIKKGYGRRVSVCADVCSCASC